MINNEDIYILYVLSFQLDRSENENVGLESGTNGSRTTINRSYGCGVGCESFR